MHLFLTYLVFHIFILALTYLILIIPQSKKQKKRSKVRTLFQIKFTSYF